MSVVWGKNIFSNIYPLIIDEYDEKLVVDKPTANVVVLQDSVGKVIENKLLQQFTPSFFSQNLCKKSSLMGRLSHKFFFFCKKLHLSKKFRFFNQKSRLCSVVIKAERCWLGRLLDDFEDIKFKPQHNEKYKIIEGHLADVVKGEDKQISNEEVQNRLNKLVALTNVFFVRHHKSHSYVTNRVPQTYFKMIFGSK